MKDMMRRNTRRRTAGGAGPALLYRLPVAVFLPVLVTAVTEAATAAAAAGTARAPPPPAVNNNDGGLLRRLQACGVADGCATLGTCNDGGYEGDCAAPGSLVCEHQLPGLNVCESPPTSAMLPCWMSEIDGSLRLNQISLPGTHNTMAKGISACLQEGRGNYVHTQVCMYVCRCERAPRGKTCARIQQQGHAQANANPPQREERETANTTSMCM